MMVEERYCLEFDRGELKRMSQMAVDSSIVRAGTAQPQSSTKLVFLGVGVAVSVECTYNGRYFWTGNFIVSLLCLPS